ncbi:unnamed protein product [Ixodes persulcatus]
MYRIGRASTTKFRSLAAAPPRPKYVLFLFDGRRPREIDLTVVDSYIPHDERTRHRVRWKLHGNGTSVDGDGQADFEIKNIFMNWFSITLAPGRHYTLYISGLIKGPDNTVIAGEELEAEVATAPLRKLIFVTYFLRLHFLGLRWGVTHFIDVLFVPMSLSCSHPSLLHGSQPCRNCDVATAYFFQIQEISDRLKINYVLVKVDGSGEESKGNNVLIETPFLPANPTVSMASCYMEKCSHAVTKMVSEKKNTPPRPFIARWVFHKRGDMSLAFTDPEDWNGERAGHRVRWKLQGSSTDGDGQADFGYRRLGSFDKNENWVSLTLEPGRYYTLYISALSKEENNTFIAGPEISTEVTTVPNEPIEVSAESMAPNKVYVKWRSVGSGDIFLVALCNGSCPPLLQNFFPLLHASYLLTNVHGSVKEQINLMSTRLHMDYVLVKVERGSEELTLHNILLELPPTLTNSTVSVACCYIDKCSNPVSTMVKTKTSGARYRLPQRRRQGTRRNRAGHA